MKRVHEGLTRGRAATIGRLGGIATVLLALAGAAVLLMPQPDPPSLREIAQPVVQRRIDNRLLFPKYADLTSARVTPFEFQQLARVQVALQSPEAAEPPPPQPVAPPAPPPAPQVDTNGLVLVGTAPGSEAAYVMLLDQQTGLIAVVERGDEVRGAVLEEITSEGALLVLGEASARLQIVQVAGSDELDRQLQGLPPSQAPAGQVGAAQHVAAAAPAPMPPQPGVAMPQPGVAMPQPAAPMPQPGAAMPQPAAPMPQPGAAMPQPGAPQPQPGAAVPQPGGGVPQPGGGAPQPVGGVPQPGGGVPQAGGGVPQPGGGVPQPGAPAAQAGAGAPAVPGQQASPAQPGAGQVASAVPQPAPSQGAVPAAQPAAASTGVPDSAGAVQRRSLGISGHMLSFTKQQELRLTQTGLLVTAVRRDDVNIRADDVILSIAGQSFESIAQAQALLEAVPAEVVLVSLFRAGAKVEVTTSLQ